jgi:hypothetical protein
VPVAGPDGRARFHEVLTMTNRPKPISDTARTLLTAAATRADRLVRLPQLPIAAARQVIRSLLNARLVEEVPAPIGEAGYAWRTGEDGGVLMLRATALGIARATEGVGAPAASGPIADVTETSAERAGTKAGGAALADNPPTDNPSGNATQPTEDAQGRPNDANRGVTAQAITHAAEAAETTSTSPGRAGRIDGLRELPRPCLTPGTIPPTARTPTSAPWRVRLPPFALPWPHPPTVLIS